MLDKLFDVVLRVFIRIGDRCGLPTCPYCGKMIRRNQPSHKILGLSDGVIARRPCHDACLVDNHESASW